MPPPITFEMMMAAASKGPRRRASDDRFSGAMADCITSSSSDRVDADRTDAAAHLLLLVTNASPRGILRKLCCDHMESGGALAHGKARAGQAASRRLDSSTPFASDRP